MTFEYSPAWPHSDIEEVLPDIFFVTGTNRTHHAGVDIQTSRGMVAVCEPEGLVLLNTVRLDEEGLRKLEAHGPIAHVVRLGAFHGRDDPFYRDRYGAKLWALPGSMHVDGRKADHALAPGGAVPLRDAEIFVFESARCPEAAILLRRDGGILITCDAIQNWATVDRYFSPASGAQLMAQGLIQPANIPTTWLAACEPDVSDFRRLLAREFHHLISAHGEPLLRDAHALIHERATEIFGQLA